MTQNSGASDPPSEADAAALTAHLEGCARCRDLAALATRLRAVSGTAIEPGLGFQSRMIAGASTRMRQRQRRRFATMAVSFGAAAVAALAVVMWAPSGPDSLGLDNLAVLDGPVESAPERAQRPLAARADMAPEPTLAEADEGRDGELSDGEFAFDLDLDLDLNFDFDTELEDGFDLSDDAAIARALLDSREAVLGFHSPLPGGPGPGEIAGRAAGLAGPLSLSSEQRQRIERILSDTHQALDKSHAELAQAREALRRCLEAESPNEAEMVRLIDRIATLEAGISKRRLRGWLEARAVLSKPQREALSARHGRRGDGFSGERREAMRAADRARREAMRHAQRARREAFQAQREALRAAREALRQQRRSGERGPGLSQEEREQIERDLEQIERELNTNERSEVERERERSWDEAEVGAAVEEAMREARVELDGAMREIEGALREANIDVRINGEPGSVVLARALDGALRELTTGERELVIGEHGSANAAVDLALDGALRELSISEQELQRSLNDGELDPEVKGELERARGELERARGELERARQRHRERRRK
ncbi:MAG: hypothetical protein Tsb0020_09120 [Haliangiales bacterium]